MRTLRVSRIARRNSDRSTPSGIAALPLDTRNGGSMIPLRSASGSAVVTLASTLSAALCKPGSRKRRTSRAPTAIAFPIEGAPGLGYLMDPFNFTAIRYTIAAIPFAVLLLAREGKGAFNLKGERHLLAWLFGTTGFAGFNFLTFLGQQLAGPTGALSAAIMTATMPLLALPVNWVMRGVVRRSIRSASSCSPLSASSW